MTDPSPPPTDTAPGALVFYSEFDDPEEWRAALLAQMPDLDFRVWPDIGNPDEVRTVFAWLPPKGFFSQFRNLTQVINLGAGVDALVGRDDLPDLPISRLSDPGMVRLMCSYVAFGVLRFARDMDDFEAAKKRRAWHYIHPRPLHRIRVGVIGLGALGASVARAIADLGFAVTGWDIAPKALPNVTCLSGEAGRLQVLGGSEIVVNMLPLTPQTRGALDAAAFGAMAQGTKFINASRGAVVVERDLIAALQSGHLGGALLDVFETEPLPQDHPFWDMDNVFITPHLASITVPETAARDVAESIRRVARGEAPLNQINPRNGF